ncbi:MAG: enoyl-CoA hydratase/isomerase family protein, partial [Nitrospinota bacterium]|nr:enoyl-CoA hydratase/isomerase family protein [Nitrospinota bacterium]
MSQEPMHWKMETDPEGVLWLGLDKAGSEVNVLSSQVLMELGPIVAGLKENPPAGLVLYSAKRKGFVAGADVNEFKLIKSEAQAFESIRQVHALLDQIEALPFPTVAMIHGYCLGGGLELALAFKSRVVSNDPSTRLGFPEVLLGIHPGYGGSVRSTRLMGGLEAMKLMLTGRTVDGKNAKRLGLADHCVPLRSLKTAACQMVLGRARGGAKPPLLGRLANLPLARNAVAALLERETSKKVRKDHYPAPFALIDMWRDHYGPKEPMLVQEARSVARLIAGPVAQNLVRVFGLQERMKGLGGDEKFNPKRVHVVGAGAMGGDIAAWLAFRGWHVTLQDTAPERVAPAIKRAGELFKKRLKDPRLAKAAMDRLEPDTAGRGAKSADIVIEAIFESL